MGGEPQGASGTPSIVVPLGDADDLPAVVLIAVAAPGVATGDTGVMTIDAWHVFAAAPAGGMAPVAEIVRNTSTGAPLVGIRKPCPEETD